MPKKKLTKRQVKSKQKSAMNAVYDLYLDKFGHKGDSFIPISEGKLAEAYGILNKKVK